jgi:hypothetical protein
VITKPNKQFYFIRHRGNRGESSKAMVRRGLGYRIASGWRSSGAAAGTEPSLNTPIGDWPTPEGGESVTVFRERIRSALLHCLTETERPLIVAHGAAGRILLDLLQVPEQHIPNCALFKFYSSSANGRTVWSVTEYGH